jgi:hypothetical protein
MLILDDTEIEGRDDCCKAVCEGLLVQGCFRLLGGGEHGGKTCEVSCGGIVLDSLLKLKVKKKEVVTERAAVMALIKS